MLDTDTLEERVEQVLQGRTLNKLQRLLQSRLGLWLIAAISFFESSLPIPIITDPFMVAGILANRSRTMLIVVMTVMSSLVGGLAAFAMAAFFFDIIATYMTDGMAQNFHSTVSFGMSDTLVTTITGAITPIPYTITAWVIAVAGGNIWIFIAASVVGRSLRYGIVGYCTYAFGPAALTYARRSLTVTSAIVLILVAIYIWLKL